jgi:hypothetical protein
MQRDFLMLFFILCFSLGNMKGFFVSSIFFLKICVIWIHVSLGLVDRFIIFSVNIHVDVLRTYC